MYEHVCMCVWVYEHVKNVWAIRKFFINNFSCDPPVINGDQMLRHKNESASQKTLNIHGHDTYIKENYSLSRERVTPFTQASSDPSIKLLPDFVFKRKGTRNQLRACSLVVSDLRLETKGSRFESGC